MADLPRLLHVRVTLAPALHERVRVIPFDAGRQVEAALAELLSDLGTDAQPVVLLREGITADPLISLQVAGVTCRFPALTAAGAFSYVTGTAQLPSVTSLAERLGDLSPRQAAELVALTCRAAVSAQPELLASPDTAEPAKAALRLGIALAGLATVTAETAADAERLIAALAPGTITVHVESGLLRDLTSADGAAEKFEFLREGLFLELGLPLPPILLRPDPSLRPGGFAARFNAVRMLPRIALPDGTILVNDTDSFMAERGFEALPTLNPATLMPAALVDARHRESLGEQGFTSWDRTGYVILSLAQDIREHIHQVVTSDVAAELTRLLGLAFPVLETAAARHAPPESLAPVLRELLASQVPVRNLRRILEILIRQETEPASSTSPDRVTAVRHGLADAIASRASRQTNTAVVYLLDKEATRAVAAMDGDESEDGAGATAARVAASLRAELAHLPPTAWVPIMLTSDETRAPLAHALRPEFPRLMVLGMGDLPPYWNVQPVARVSLG
jgi:flagellar biosynthesis component FlhA